MALISIPFIEINIQLMGVSLALFSDNGSVFACCFIKDL